MSQVQIHPNTKNYFDQKVIWVTGASSGIGRAVVELLLQMDTYIIVSARNGASLQDFAHSWGQDRVRVVPMDQSVSQSVTAAAAAALSWHGRVDVLFNNGGVSQRSLAMDTSDEVLRRIMEVNFFANVALTQSVLPAMTARGRGHIVVTSSLMGKWGFYLRSAYGASKHALHGYYDSLRMEVEGKGVAVTLLTPGFIATEISKHALTGNGQTSGEMDENQAKGMSVAVCAAHILAGVAKGNYELPVGGKELRGLWVKRFFPHWFEKILRKQQAR